MNLRPWHTLGVAVLAVIMTVGCSATAAPAVQSPVAPPVAVGEQDMMNEGEEPRPDGGQVIDPEDFLVDEEEELRPVRASTPIILEDYLIDETELRVSELEARLEGLRWTEEEAIAVVQREISDRLVACEEHSHDVQDGRGTFGMRVDGLGTGESGGCAYHEDIVLRGTGFRTTNFGINLGGSITEVLLESPGSWTAVYESRFHRWRVEALAPDIPTMSFHVYERTGLVVGVAPTGQ
jgi:hypothetical protein